MRNKVVDTLQRKVEIQTKRRERETAILETLRERKRDIQMMVRTMTKRKK